MPPASLAKVQNNEMREFVEMCIVHDPSRRPEARQLLKHCFFDSIRNSDKTTSIQNDFKKGVPGLLCFGNTHTLQSLNIRMHVD